MSIRVQTETFDPGAMLNRLHGAQTGVGAVVGFVGYVRDFNDGEEVAGMLLEHYPGMTEKALQLIVDEANGRWPLLGVDVLHRVGRLEPGEPIVFVGVSSAHRAAAFEASHFIIDYLKTRAPFWKKEDTGSGPRWVDAREQDSLELDKWQGAPGPGQGG
jgi:molybdopterin synthase catalytic subunit